MEPNRVVGLIFIYINPRYLFSEFPIMLHEWLSKLVTQQRNFQGGEPKEWNPQLIQGLEGASNLVSRDVDFWIDSILEGYITELLLKQ